MSGERGPFPDEAHLYVLRVWFERDGQTLVWRASLLLDRDSRRHFSSASALLHFLEHTLVKPPNLNCREAPQEAAAATGHENSGEYVDCWKR